MLRGIIDDEDNMRRVRDDVLKRLAESQERADDTGPARKRISRLDDLICKGVEKLVDFDAEDAKDVSRMLKEWRAERRALRRRLVVAKRDGGQDPQAVADEMV
ncbi:MAG: hypothetical protein IID44_23620 [Planctomycetes bacterium]|nr:hypothetical protein [Planctomycetota bacterium]